MERTSYFELAESSGTIDIIVSILMMTEYCALGNDAQDIHDSILELYYKSEHRDMDAARMIQQIVIDAIDYYRFEDSAVMSDSNLCILEGLRIEISRLCE